MTSELRVDRIVPTTGVPTGGAGSVIQVVQTVKSDHFSSSSTSYVDITGMAATITPKSTSNKILIQVNVQPAADSWGGGAVHFRLLRGSTEIGSGTDGTSINGMSYFNAWANNQTNSLYNSVSMAMNFLDSPSTTSATTYKVQGLLQSSGYNWYINRSAANTQKGASSTITLMELSA
jgi:hypothetical protein